MRDFTGKLLRGGRLFLEPVIGALDEGTLPSGMPYWAGTLTLTEGQDFPAGEGLTLVLDDGRSGEVSVGRETDHGAGIHTTLFTGLGPLR
jgi:hypothetical protein